jgi:hypothetical protein
LAGVSEMCNKFRNFWYFSDVFEKFMNISGIAWILKYQEYFLVLWKYFRYFKNFQKFQKIFRNFYEFKKISVFFGISKTFRSLAWLVQVNILKIIFKNHKILVDLMF